MLIDAVHPEETRVALISEGRVDDFDFEAAGKKQLRGNIYLAKVTRVEPSLQAAFVEYGGNRHGFLAFSEIHPDYYQLPQEDREKLLQEEAEEAAAEAAAEDADDEAAEAAAPSETLNEDVDADPSDAKDEASADADGDADDEDDAPADPKDISAEDEAQEEAHPKRKRRNPPSKRYKIQEVIRRRQVMLVQVVKEERGNKGAALTTYLSLAGRYCVLMPNTPRGGGISRKISVGADRKRLKKIMSELEVPKGMGLIVRTAGAKRTKTEIKRDFDYLQKLWDKIRDLTLKSMAPCLINEEGGLVHRAMRDLYDKDVEQVLIQGEAAYREAKDLAKLLMPSHAAKVKQWKHSGPLFVERNVEEQLDSIFSPQVRLPSGGYLVINQTEALVAIDVNSGKSTRERNIEQTALRTNLEAAEEACRQMRLRDLAGLVVIDFIDMEENKNNRTVEKKLKECLKLDRARVQHGRISQFGLMEISRQRRRAGVLDSSSDPCKHCNGTGRTRSVQSAALQLLRALEARASGGGLLSLTAEAPADVAIYLLNNKREACSQLEDEAGVSISFSSSDSMIIGDFTLHAERDPQAKRRRKVQPLIEGDPDDEAFAAQIAAENAASEAAFAAEYDAEDDENGEEEGGRRKRRRGRRRKGREDASSELDVIDLDDDDRDEETRSAADDEEEEDGGRRKNRRRGRRGGRRRRRGEGRGPSETAIAALEDTERALALPAIESKPATGKDAASEDGGAYLDGISMMASELLTDDLSAVWVPREESPEQDGSAKADTEDAPRKRRRRRRGKAAADADSGTSASDTLLSDESSEAAPVTIEVTADPDTEGAVLAEISDPVPADPTLSVDAASDGAAGELVGELPEVAESPAPADETAAEKSAPEPAEAAVEGDAAPEAAEPELAEPVAETPEPDRPKRRGWWSRRKTG